MTIVPLSHLAERAKEMPEGYLADVLSKGTVRGDGLELSDEAYQTLIQKYSGGPSLVEMASNFFGATLRWVKAGLPVTSEVDWKARLAICQACEHYRPEALVSSCAKCGCAEVKLWLATERCPEDKWKAQKGP